MRDTQIMNGPRFFAETLGAREESWKLVTATRHKRCTAESQELSVSKVLMVEVWLHGENATSRAEMFLKATQSYHLKTLQIPTEKKCYFLKTRMLGVQYT